MRRTISKRIRKQGDGVSVVGDVNAVVAANTGKRGEKQQLSRRQRIRVVQRGDRTEVIEEEEG